MRWPRVVSLLLALGLALFVGGILLGGYVEAHAGVFHPMRVLDLASTLCGYLGLLLLAGALIVHLVQHRDARLRSSDPVQRQRAVEELGESKAARAVALLVKALRDEDLRVHMAARKGLINTGEAAVGPLLAALEDEEQQVRQAAAAALGEIGAVRAVEPLVVALGDGDAHVRQSAAMALDRLGWKATDDAERALHFIASQRWEELVPLGPVAVEPLLMMLSEDSVVRRDAVNVLGRLGDARATGPLLAMLEGVSSSDRQAAIQALGRLRDARATGPLLALLGGADSSERRAAIHALVHIGDPRSVDSLLPLVRDVEVGGFAAQALGEIGDQRAVEPLISALVVREARPREQCRRGSGVAGRRARDRRVDRRANRRPCGGRGQKSAGQD